MLELFLTAAMLAAPASFTQEPEAVSAQATPAEDLAALQEEFDEENRVFRERYRAAPEEERPTILEERPDPNAYAVRFLALADANAGTEVAAEALIWVVRSADDDEVVGQALDVLLAGHLESESLGGICSTLERNYTRGEGFLLALMNESPHKDVRGEACYSLARLEMDLAQLTDRVSGGNEEMRQAYAGWLGDEVVARIAGSDPAARRKEAERLFEIVILNYAKVEHHRGTLGKAAKANLFELRHLAIGEVVPDIEGEDIDGVPFKLSDYHGKVVMIDFWGDW